jgi:hypothetical protein
LGLTFAAQLSLLQGYQVFNKLKWYAAGLQHSRLRRYAGNVWLYGRQEVLRVLQNNMAFNLILAISVAVILGAAALRILAPHLYDKYVSRSDGPAGTADKGSSQAGSITALVLFFIVVTYFLLSGPSREAVTQRTANPRDEVTSVVAWIGLVCVSLTGVLLCLFPANVIRRLLPVKIADPSVHPGALRRIKIFGRLIGTLFLLGAVLIARQLIY